MLTFDFMDRPSDANMKSAIDELVNLGAIAFDETTKICKLTPLGRNMAIFPLEPRFSKLLITSKDFNCRDEILSIVSLISVENLFFIPPDKREVANEVHRKFSTAEGDLIRMLNVYKSCKSAKMNSQWCRENFIHITNIRSAMQIRKQLEELCGRTKPPISLSSCGQNTECIRRCIASALSSNVALLKRDGTYRVKDIKKDIHIHPSSCLFGTKPDCVVFTELVQTSKCYMRNLTLIQKEWIC